MGSTLTSSVGGGPPAPRRFAFVSAAAALTLPWLTARAAPFIPKRDDQVLLTLPRGATPSDALRRNRAELARQPASRPLAVQLAWEYINRSRAEADPRWLGFAESVLAPWWHEARPPSDVLVLRATIRQSTHDFDGALADLEAVLSTEPTNAQALLTKMTILQVRGDYEQARGLGLPLYSAAPGLAGTTSVCALGSLTGSAAASAALLARTLDANPQAPVAERVFAATVLAEIDARLGRPTEADARYRQALAFGQPDGYLLNSYADFLLDQHRPAEVLPLVGGSLSVDDSLLRFLLAKKALDPHSNGLAEGIAELRARYEANRHRGPSLHCRSEARFQLHLLGDARRALEFARANWDQHQREPVDVCIYLECAQAAGDRAAAKPVLDWLASRHLEDVRIAPLVAALQ